MDLVQHGLVSDGLVHPDGVDAHFLHQREVLRERFEAALVFAHWHRVVADALDEVLTLGCLQPAVFHPNPGDFRG